MKSLTLIWGGMILAVTVSMDLAATMSMYPVEDTSFLLNPGKGWVIYSSLRSATPEALAKASVGYNRYIWSAIHTGDNTFNWSVIDNDLNYCISKGKKYAFGVMTLNINNSSSTLGLPDWVVAAGCKYYMASGAPNCKVPYWDDPVFLAKQQQFATALINRYNGNPNIAYIDCRTFGNWGEWHLGMVGGSVSESIQRSYIDQWSGFTKTQIIVPISGGAGMYKGGFGYYARDKYHWGYREDSGDNFPRWANCAPGLNSAPAVCEWSTSYRALKSGSGWSGEKWYDAMVSGPVTGSKYSYVNMGQWGSDCNLFLSEKAYLVDEWQNKMGYWFKLTQVDYPDNLGNGSAGTISFKVRNDGVAPIYVNWNPTDTPTTYVRLALIDGNNNVLARTSALSGINPFNWKPGQTIANTASFSFPATTGAARLAIGIFSSTSLNNPDILFAVTGRLASGWYPIVPAVLSAPHITSTAVTTARVGRAYLYTVVGIGNPTPTYTASGMPTWLSFDASTATFSGTPIAAGTTGTITVTETNSLGSDNQTFTITTSSTVSINAVTRPKLINESGVMHKMYSIDGREVSASVHRQAAQNGVYLVTTAGRTTVRRIVALR